MKTLDLDPTRAAVRGHDLESRRVDADLAFDGALRDATTAESRGEARDGRDVEEREVQHGRERAEADVAPPRDQGAGDASLGATAVGEATAPDLTTGDDSTGATDTNDDALSAADCAAADAASLALAVASAASSCAAQALPIPEGSAAGAQRRARPGIRGDLAGPAGSDAAGALSSRDGEHGQQRGDARACEGAASPPRAGGIARGGGAAAQGAGPAQLADPAHGDASAREELGGGARSAEAGDDAARAHGEVPATGGAPGTGAPSLDRAAPPLDLASLRPQPAAAPEVSVTEPFRTPAATPHLQANETGADGAVLRNAAHLRVAAPGLGDIELHLRVLDGVAHLRVDGDAARVVESRAAELSRALAGEGLRLGQLDTRPAHSPSFAGPGDFASRHHQHQGSGDPRDEPSPGAPRQPVPRPGPAPTPPASNGGYAVRA